MSLSFKRKRGRPRHDEPREINDFDVTLIQEFQKRPALYDRSHPLYRNREQLEPLWDEMAHNLGFNVALVKNRMLQLRNRYNLEKRRVESLQEQYNDKDITSQWVLYDNLNFLSDHIKSRRSYTKQMLPVQTKQAPTSNSSADEDYEDSQHYGNDNVIETDNDHYVSTTNHIDAIAKGYINSQKAALQQQPMTSVTPAAAAAFRVRNQMEMCSPTGVDKFKAFGQFLTSSLIEMNEKDALRLVEKFTSELVKSLLAESNKSNKIYLQNEDTDTTNMDLSI